jgi:hypothetical protein
MGSNKSILIIFGILGFSIAVLIFFVGSNVLVFETDYFDKCKHEYINEPIHNFNNRINNENTGLTILEPYLNTTLDFLEFSIKPCGYSYLYIDNVSNIKYDLCQDGSLFLIDYICSDESAFKKTKTFLKNNSSELFEGLKNTSSQTNYFN